MTCLWQPATYIDYVRKTVCVRSEIINTQCINQGGKQWVKQAILSAKFSKLNFFAKCLEIFCVLQNFRGFASLKCSFCPQPLSRCGPTTDTWHLALPNKKFHRVQYHCVCFIRCNALVHSVSCVSDCTAWRLNPLCTG